MSSFGAMLDRIQDATLRGGADNRTQLKLELNEAIKQVDALLRPAVSSSVETIVANDGDYSLLNDFAITDLTSIRDIQFQPQSGLGRSLRQSTPETIREQRFLTSNAYWSDLYATEGLDLLLIYPVVTTPGSSITIWYVPRSADLTLDSDVPSGLPIEWHELYEYACIPRSMRQTSPEETMRYMSMYEKKLGDYRKWRNRRMGARSRIVYPTPSLSRLPHDPSTDLGYR